MKEIQFPNWPEWLAQTQMPKRQKQSFAITLRWYLSFCRQGCGGVTVQSARDFIEWAQAEQRPQPWQLEGWKEAIRWFFRAAKEASACGLKSPPADVAHGERCRGLDRRTTTRPFDLNCWTGSN